MQIDLKATAIYFIVAISVVQTIPVGNGSNSAQVTSTNLQKIAKRFGGRDWPDGDPTQTGPYQPHRQ